MKYKVVALRRADADVRHIVEWIAQRSLQGAKSWLDAYEQLLERLATRADTYPAALENPDALIVPCSQLWATKFEF
jgi:plasmid stabilization system protein ParE